MSIKKEKFQNKILELFLSVNFENNFMVSLRGPSAKHFWDAIEKFGEHLEELSVGDEEVKNV